MALVEQKPFLFADTIRNNVKLNRDYEDHEIWEWLSIAGIDEEVHRFPKQLDTSLGEWGLNLSGGQKQRLTIARALAARPQILLLDDCLSAVDTVTEERILRAMNEYLADTTSVWTAHRRSTRLRWTAAVYLVAFALAVTWPGALLINRVHPLILGLPFNMVWILLWVLGGGVMLYLVDRVEHP